MKFRLYQVTGYAEAIMALRMSKSKYYSWEKALAVHELCHVCTNSRGFLATPYEYEMNMQLLNEAGHYGKVTGHYETDIAEFKRLLTLTFNQAMKEQKHHTLMKYIDVSFFTEGLHRGATDDLDSHAIAFHNRITRFSTRLAEISEQKVSEWYQDKVIPFHEAHKIIRKNWDMFKELTAPEEVREYVGEGEDLDYLADGTCMPREIVTEKGTFVYTPFGYVLEKFAQVPAKNGLAKDVQRGLMALGTPSNALWKIDFANLRYVYKMRNWLTKANPELKEGMEQLADQVEQAVVVFGEYFRKEFTDSGKWEHVAKVKTITSEEFEQFKKWKKEKEKEMGA